jgi:hypothetical protein
VALRPTLSGGLPLSSSSASSILTVLQQRKCQLSRQCIIERSTPYNLFIFGDICFPDQGAHGSKWKIGCVQKKEQQQ